MKLIDETYVCPICGWPFTVWRRSDQLRARNHKKRLYCLNCNKNRDFIREGQQ